MQYKWEVYCRASLPSSSREEGHSRPAETLTKRPTKTPTEMPTKTPTNTPTKAPAKVPPRHPLSKTHPSRRQEERERALPAPWCLQFLSEYVSVGILVTLLWNLLVQQYKWWGAYCCRNWKCAAVLSKPSCTGCNVLSGRN